MEDHISLSIEDTDTYPSWKFLPELDHGRSWLGVPLIAGGQILGLFSLEKDTPGFFTQEYRVLAESLAAQAAVTLQNAKLHRQLRKYASELDCVLPSGHPNWPIGSMRLNLLINPCRY